MINLIREDRIVNEQIDQFLSRIQLKESTLSQLLGSSEEGQLLIKWLHRHEGISNTAEYGLVVPKTTRIQWMMFKSSPDNFIIVQGRNAVVAIKPDQAKWNELRAHDEARRREFKPSHNTYIEYQLVGYSADGERIDNQLLPYPDPKDFKLDDRDVKRINANPNLLEIEPRYREYAQEIKNVEAKQQKKISLNAPPTQISSRRGGMPFGPDLHHRPHALFDQMKNVIPGPYSIYTAVTHRSDIPKRDVKGFVKDFTPSEVPKGEIQGDFGEPAIGSRREGGIEREKIGLRRPAKNPSKEFNRFISRIKPILPNFIERASNTISAQRRAASGIEQMRAYRDIANKLDDFEVSLSIGQDFVPNDASDAVSRIVSAAIAREGNVDLSSPEGLAYLEQLNQPGSVAKLKPILRSIYQQLVNGS